MPFTTDPTDPRLGHGVDAQARPQHEVYLVLSEDERKKGFVRPVRRSYRHVGVAKITNPLRDLTDEEQVRYAGSGYVKFEVYPDSESPKTGRFWTQEALDNIAQGCGTVTTMGMELAETFARQPDFYGSAFCVHCSMHIPVDEFIWVGSNERLGS
jgi:hypothetical protein